MEPALPADGDDGVVDAHARPVHLRLASLGLVWAGGTAGTGTRYLVSAAVPDVARVPAGIVAINIVGAFLLGLLLEVLIRRGDDSGRRRRLRLLLGTGFLGGFTTYSALSVDTVVLFRMGLPGHAVAYAGATVLLGGVATAAGIWLAGRVQRRPPSTPAAT